MFLFCTISLTDCIYFLSKKTLKKAEIEYAMEIIKDFRRGNLPDCADGATLRPYLAKKLSKAMNNSDSNAANPGSNGPGYIHMPQTPTPSQRFTDLERAFHKATLDRKAILASSASSTVSSVCSSKAPTPPPAATKNTGVTLPVSVPPPPPRTAAPTVVPAIFGQEQSQTPSRVSVSNPVSGAAAIFLVRGKVLFLFPSSTIVAYTYFPHNPLIFCLTVRDANVPVWSAGATPTYDPDQFHRRRSSAESGLDASPDG